MSLEVKQKSRYGVIYKITNTLNNKSYIGQTINKDPTIRYRAHFVKNRAVDLIYKSYIKNNKNRNIYQFEILYSSFDIEDLNQKEIYFINQFNTLVPNGYNIKSGGAAGGKCAEETKIKIGAANRGKTSNKGIPKSLDHRLVMSKARKGLSTENRRRVQAAMAKTLRKPIIAIKIDTGIEICFNSIAQCAMSLNLKASRISDTILGVDGRKKLKGYKFIKICQENNA
jgi:group I intron endonuclease